MMLRHSVWSILPAPEADTNAEARRTHARPGVRSFPMDQTRPSCATRAGGHLHLSGHRDLIRNVEKFSRIQNFKGKFLRIQIFTFDHILDTH